ncbi:pimeloyl-ACP methyl ester carboxylesterase [Actinopolyspora lacussalsi]|nr:pimeloyl-ACP methyl ester carboxylesterase [Actinopolyspora lacussalsi]
MITRTSSEPWALSQRIRVPGGEVAAEVFGEGPPVVLVHGAPSWSYLWRGVVPSLARNHTVYVWDLPGFGDSRLAPGVWPSIELQARTLAELVDHWGLSEPGLVGHDIGGGIVMRAHLIEQVPTRGLALLDAAVLGPWNTPFTEHQQRYPQAYRTMPEDVFTDVIDKRLRSACHRRMSEEVAEAYLSQWSGQAGQNRWIDQVVSVSFNDTREAVAKLDRVTAPTLVLWGEQDQWLSTTTGDRLAAAIPGAQRANITAAGHFVAEDNPNDTADALLRFFG